MHNLSRGLYSGERRSRPEESEEQDATGRMAALYIGEASSKANFSDHPRRFGQYEGR
jgi:hypothetical protein